MDETQTREVLDFLLSSYRAQMAIQNPREDCPFDFQQFFTTWKEKYENFSKLREVMKKSVTYLVEEGIFDSIIPYLSASMNQSSNNGEEGNKARDEIIKPELLNLTPITVTKQNRKISELLLSPKHPKQISVPEDKIEITIHVCDEAKSLRQDFKCIQSVLLREMGYFSKVAVRGQKLKDMDISVHCDIGVFDWLMKWIKFKDREESTPIPNPKLDATNVIGLMVSAEFLQMPTLTQECVLFTAHNMEDVILHSPNLGCLSESLTNKIATFFDNIELEEKIAKVDVNDRITSRLYTQYVLALNLNNEEPDSSKLGQGGSWRGHFASAKTMFKCHLCQKLLTNEVASKVPCTTSSMRLDSRGKVYSVHVKEMGWSLPNFVRELKRELKAWRKVYWRLWGLIHFLPCATCHLYFPLRDLTSCRFHPKPPQFDIRISLQTGEYLEREFPPDTGQFGTGSPTPEEFVNPYRRFREEKLKEEEELANVQQYETLRCVFGVYPCCKRSGYKFNPFPEVNGCAVRDHVILPTKQNAEILRRLELFRDLIVVTPPKQTTPQPPMKWGGVHDLSPPKTFTPSTPLSGRFLIQRPITLLPSGQPETTRTGPENQQSQVASGHTLSSSGSDGEGEEFGFLRDGKPSLPAAVPPPPQFSPGMNSDFWNWNNDFTTRYNQDMQREREEKLMADLELLLAQKTTNMISASNTDIRFSPFLGSRRHFKNLGGSYLQVEEKWRTSNKTAPNSRVSKSAKPS